MDTLETISWKGVNATTLIPYCVNLPVNRPRRLTFIAERGLVKEEKY